MTSPVPVEWDALAADLRGDRAAVARFVRAYADLLEERIDRVEGAIVARSAADAEAALLTVYCTSAMAGAAGLADLAHDALTALRSGGPAAGASYVPRLREAAQDVRTTVAATLEPWRVRGRDGGGRHAGASNR